MEQINIHEAKTHLSALVDKAAKGDSFIIANIIAKAGKPMVTVISYALSQKPIQRIGFLKGDARVPADFDRMGETTIPEMFEGER